MGATTFKTEGSGKTAHEAFRAAVDSAAWEYGHGGYTGSIAEKVPTVGWKQLADAAAAVLAYDAKENYGADDQGLNLLADLNSALEAVTGIDVYARCENEETCECGATVTRDEDQYFATPCGTFCDDCMTSHAKECEVCRGEFDIEEEDEEEGAPQ